MSQRKIKDAKDLETNEVIYFKGHAKATYMSDGRNVEDAINQVGTGGSGGGVVAETDPIFSASAAAKITDSNISTWNGKQDKITDLEAIRSGAAKGATALQSYTEQYKGTVTGVKINGSTKYPSSGVVDLGTVITSHQDISGKMDNISVQNHGTSSTTLSVAPNVLHKWGTVSILTITLTAPTNTSVYNEYMIQFSSGSTPTTLSVPSTVKWVVEPKIEANKTYQISIVDNIGIIVGV